MNRRFDRDSSVGRAFTLVEVLVAIVLAGMIVGGLVNFVFGLVERRDRAAAMMKGELGASALFARLESDLSMTFARSQSGESGMVGTSTQLRVLSRRSLPVVIGVAGGDGIDRGIEIRFDASAGAIVARGISSEAGDFEVMIAGVERCAIRYFAGGGRAWVSEIDTGQAGADGGGTLPAAVEVSVWFGRAGGSGGGSRGRGDNSGSDGDEGAGLNGADRGLVRGPDRAPDRQRVFVVPDAPAAGWKEGT
jgi:prepilin-type N-terminal cleavage/methylation domain-containing protein